jgi:tetratricopeptide (TPR) repeat protein
MTLESGAPAPTSRPAAIYRDIGDRHSEGISLDNLGLTLRQVGRFEEAITAHQDAAAIYRDTGGRHREAGALNNLSAALREVRRFEEAITACQDAAAIFGEAGDEYRERVALGRLDLPCSEGVAGPAKQPVARQG